ncbi:hypothetical protein [Sphingosinicella sp. BN140058]|nr:hypothetical protein [Sphingosinicella sp. BN140058]
MYEIPRLNGHFGRFVGGYSPEHGGESKGVRLGVMLCRRRLEHHDRSG